MTDKELDKWWQHLQVETKVRVANGMPYPRCTEWWMSLSHEARETLYNIAGGRDAHDHHKWKKGNGSFT